MRKAATEKLMPPLMDEVNALEEFPGQHHAELEYLPWLSILCIHRDFFRDTCIRVTDDVFGMRLFKFVYAHQSPYLAVFAVIEEVDEGPGDMGEPAMAWNNRIEANWRRNFKVVPYSFASTHWQDFFSASVVEYLGPGRVAGGDALGSDAEWRPIELVSDMFPVPNPKEPADPRPRRPAIDPKMLKDFPMLQDWVDLQEKNAHKVMGDMGAAAAMAMDTAERTTHPRRSTTSTSMSS